MTFTEQEIAAILQREFLFQGLTFEEVQLVASRFTPSRVDKRSVLYQQGSQGNGFYLILEGKIRLSRQETRLRRKSAQGTKTERVLNILSPGDYFGEEALLSRQPYLTTARAIEPCLLLYLSVEQAQEILKAFPSILTNLRATSETRHLFVKQKFDWLTPEEVVYFIGRKHVFFLIRAIFLPTLLGLTIIPVVILGVIDWLNQLLPGVGLTVGLLIFLFSVFGIVWNWLDWGNDFYIVTSRRLVWVEKVIFLYDSRTEVSLDKVRETKVFSRFWGRLIGYGDVTANTYIGAIVMQRAANPYILEKFIISYRERFILVSRETEAKAFSESMEEALRVRRNAGSTVQQPSASGSTQPKTTLTSPAIPNQQSAARSKSQRFVNRLDNVRNTFKFRYEKNGEITYRKHWLILIRKAGLPFFFSLLILIISILVFLLHIPLSYCLPLVIAEILGILITGYQFLDWVNDIYRLTPRQILDIERKPLRDETRKTANLEDIQSVEHNRTNLLELIFNYGRVTINVAAGNPFIFYWVAHPDQVHLDISRYQDELKRKKAKEEEERERQRMLEYMMVYNESTGKLKKEENSPRDGNQR